MTALASSLRHGNNTKASLCSSYSSSFSLCAYVASACRYGSTALIARAVILYSARVHITKERRVCVCVCVRECVNVCVSVCVCVIYEKKCLTNITARHLHHNTAYQYHFACQYHFAPYCIPISQQGLCTTTLHTNES